MCFEKNLENYYFKNFKSVLKHLNKYVEIFNEILNILFLSILIAG